MQRKLITLGLLLGAVFMTYVFWLNSNQSTTKPADSAPAAAKTDSTTPAGGASASPAAGTVSAAPAALAPAPVSPVQGLHVVKVTQKQPEPTLGSAAQDTKDKPNPFYMEAGFTPWAGGLTSLKFSRYSVSVQNFDPYPIQRKLVESEITQGDSKIFTYRYPMAMQAVTVNGQRIELLAERWQVVADQTDDKRATFAITLAGADDKPVLRITRAWSLAPGRYDLQLAQKFENLSAAPLDVSFSQFGPQEITPDHITAGTDSAQGTDFRHVILGYLQPLQTSAETKYITTKEFDFARADVLKNADPAIWPKAGDDPQRDLYWISLTNQYFAVALHAPVQSVDKPLPISPSEVIEQQFPRLSKVIPGAAGVSNFGLMLDSAPRRLAAAGSEGASAVFNLEMYAGPRDPSLLKVDPAYVRLGLGQLIIYNMGGPCSFCTFDSVAQGMLAFLRFIHAFVRDWGMSIIVLVALVRLILHPLTKSSQVNMMKMSKQMAELKPAIDKLKAKYGSDQQKMNAEMMALYKEKGVNPMAMGFGCLPMFLQMPIWFALYAMLNFAIELRHQPAFYGVFQAVSGGKWQFLADLSSQDNFISLPHLDLGLFAIDSINLLPILMGVVFWLQQKYMTPQNPTMDEQQRQQQAMMKWMVLLMPVMLYKSACGLNLYILASTTVGIIESKRVRSHLKQLEAEGRLFEKKVHKPGSLMDRIGKAIDQRRKMLEDNGGDNGGANRRKK